MKLFAVALILLVCVILIVSLTYILVTTRHKEKMTLLDKGLDPKDYMDDRLIPNTLRVGMLLFGVGIGFLGALYVDEYLLTSIDNPAIYAGMILLFGGISQISFYSFFHKTFQKNSSK